MTNNCTIEPTGESQWMTAPSRAPGAMTERYRPKRVAEIAGQPAAVRFLTRFAAAPYPAAMLFEGDTGTGKTSAALALAADLGCAVEQQELGGLWSIASGEQTADAVREVCQAMWRIPFYGNGWKVVTVNEADRTNPQAETIWLDRLESLPPRTVIIFTTNHPEKLSQRFRDRCLRVRFESNAAKLKCAAAELAAQVWMRETGEAPQACTVQRVIRESIEDGALSFRRLLQGLQMEILSA